MTLRVTTLASGSEGNSVLLQTAESRVLIDAGLATEELEERVAAAGVEPRRVDALILTHRHRDHVRGATEFCRKHRTPVWVTRRTGRSLGSETYKWQRKLQRMEWSQVRDLRVFPIPVEHDAPETVALLVETVGGVRYGHVTDLGCTAGEVGQILTQCDGLYLEFNYEPELLEACEYPPHLKARIAGPQGHLSNQVAAELLARLVHPGMQCVWLAHVSQRSNTSELALRHAREAVGDAAIDLRVAPQAHVDTPVELARQATSR